MNRFYSIVTGRPVLTLAVVLLATLYVGSGLRLLEPLDIADAGVAARRKHIDEAIFGNQFKRSCLPDGPKVGSISLSPRGDWRMPSDAAASH